MHAPPTLSRISSRREFASSPQSTPRALLLAEPEGGGPPLQDEQDDAGSKRKGLASRSLTLAQLLHSLLPFSPASPGGLPRAASMSSFAGAAAPPLPAEGAGAAASAAASSGAGAAAPAAAAAAAAGGGGGGGLRPLQAALLRRASWACARLPCALALLILLVTAVTWEVAPARRGHDPALPTHIPALVIPTSPGRGPSLLATLRSLESRVEVLLLCNSAPQVPELQCVLEEVALLAAQGELNIGRVRVVTPRAPSPVYGVAECWNAGVDAALADEALRAPWVLVMNDDVGLPQGALGAAVEETWRTHQRHSLLLAHEGLPGAGYAFSAFVLTRAGRAALGSFDENFFPAYYEVRARAGGIAPARARAAAAAAPRPAAPSPPSQPPPSHPPPPLHPHANRRGQDCDYFRRAQLLGMPWRRLPQLRILHPIHKYLPRLPAPSARQAACVAAAAAAAPPAAAAAAQGVQSAVGAMLQRARSATAWRDFAHSDRYYYQKKWGGALNKCGQGDFATPFNNPLHTLAFWEPDAAMRRATLAGTALEAL